MRLTRRQTLKLLSAAAPAFGLASARASAAVDLPITAGPFKGRRESLAAYRMLPWFDDADIGISLKLSTA